MSFAEIQKLKELLGTLQESGEITSATRAKVGKAIEELQKERKAARLETETDISQPLELFESSYEKSSVLGESWKPPWDQTWHSLSPEELRNKPTVLNPRAFDINLRRGASHVLDELDQGGKYSGLDERTKEILVRKLNYRVKLEESYAQAARRIDSKDLWKRIDDPAIRSIQKKIDKLDESIYQMGATEWDSGKNIPEDWKDTLKAYTKRDAFEEMSGPFFTGGYVPGGPGTNLLSFNDPKKILSKAGVFTQKQWRDKEAAQQELQFINNYLLDPEMASEYAKTAPLSFLDYWSKKGGILGLKEHMQSLKTAARAEDVEFETAKWGALTTIKDLKTKNFAFASLRGQVVELWEPASPKISQVGLFQDASGERIKFTIWKNQQQNIPKVEAGKNYYFGNVASQEWQGKWNLNVNQYSAVEEIEPAPFSTPRPLIVPGAKVELRDYSKPYSIDPLKGTITYTTKSGKVVEMPVEEVDMTPLRKTFVGEERGDLAAVVPLVFGNFSAANQTAGLVPGKGIDLRMQETELAMSLNPLLQLGSLTGGQHAPKLPEVLSKWYPEQLAPLKSMGEFMEQGFSVPGVGGPMAVKGAYAMLPPELLSMIKRSGLEGIRGIRQLFADERAALGPEATSWEKAGISRTEYVKKKLAEAEESAFIEQPVSEPVKPPEPSPLTASGFTEQPKEWPADALMAEYDARRLKELSEKQSLTFAERSELDDLIFREMFKDVGTPKEPPTLTQEDWLSIERYSADIQRKARATVYPERAPVAEINGEPVPPLTEAEMERVTEEIALHKPAAPVIETRLEALSKKPVLTLAEKKELDDLFFKEMSKDVGSPVEPAPLTEEDWLAIDRYNTDIQRRMKAKYYKTEPTFTINGRPVMPASEAEQEKAMSELEGFRKSLGIEEPASINAVTSPVPSTSSFQQDVHAEGIDDAYEPLVQEIVGRREVRGKITTEDDIRRIRNAVADNPTKKGFPWQFALGTGAGAAAAASFFSLPGENKEEAREQVREALEPSNKQGVLENAVDILSTDSYLEGAALMNLKAWLAGDSKRYGWGDKITPSVALGIQEKDTSLFSLFGLAGTALDIAIAPTTYLSFGSGAAVKIGSAGGRGAKALKLSKQGVKELRGFTQRYGGEMGTLEFAHHIEQSQDFKKKVLAAGGVNLRGWGKEVNLIPGSAFEPIAKAARESRMQFALEHPEGYRWLTGKWETLEDRFVVKAAIRRLPRSPRLAPMEADYIERSLLLPKKVRFDIAQGTKRDIELAKKARKAFGEGYEETVSNLIEVPAARESASLTEEQRAIVEELESYNKAFAAQEKELGLLDTEMSGYLRHTLTPEAKEYLEKGGRKVSTEVYTPLSVENKFAAKRKIRGTVAEINERARRELGIDFDYFESNPFKATSIRRAESVQAVEQARLLKWTVEKYGVSEEFARAHPGEYVQTSVDYIKSAWLPKPIAEDIEKEFVRRDTSAALQYYDKALSAWKYGATVTHPAYHATNVVGGMFNNWLGEINPISYYRGSRVLLGGDKEKLFKTALGEQFPGGQLLKEAGEAGILAQPGMMDIEKLSYDIADTQKEKSIELAKKLANTPITSAQYEENFLRFSMYIDRRMKGDTVQGARDWVSRFQFEYSKESFTEFERDYMKRMVPFWAWMRGNVPLQAQQMVLNPGKYVQLSRVTGAAVGGQELPQWSEGDLAAAFPFDNNTGQFEYMRSPAADMEIFNRPLWYNLGVVTPFAKYPVEKALGYNTYTLQDFSGELPWYDPKNSAESSLVAGRTGRDVATLSEDRNAWHQILKYGAGIGHAATGTRKRSDKGKRDLYRKYTARPNDFTYEQRLAFMERDNWASAESGISGEFEQLQGGHFYPAALGGAALPWNYITQTREENLEWLSAQLYIENLPERELQREEAWERYEAEYTAGVEEINARTLDTRGRPENEAQKEKRRYDLRKAANIKMYNRQLNTVRAAMRSAEKDLRGEKKKVEDARAKGYSDPASEAQIKVIEAVLAEYGALYEKVSGLRDEERGKEFELPVQGTDLSKFQPMDIGGYDKYAVRYGKGPELAKPEDIEKLVDLKKITAYYAAMKSYGPVVGFRPGTPEAVKNRILFTRDARYEELAQIANPLMTGVGWEGISGKNYIGPRNISELREVVEGSVSEPEPVMGAGEPPAAFSEQPQSQEPRQAAEFDYNDPEFREAVREIVNETLSEGIATD